MSELYPFRGLPPAQGLYRPEHEHDACGIGFVANIEGRKSHDIVLKGMQILINLTHRGACGCDPQTGDGAGILIQIPHAFFEREAASLGFSLPSPGEYGVGMVFLPVDPHDRLICEGIIEKIAREEGLTVLGWRDTPINGNTIGRLARASQPYIEQIFIRSGPGMDQDALERKLYVVRKRAESAIAATDLKEKDFFYIPSLSSRTIIYKGLLLAPQITDFYKELLDPELTSALCLVHQRFSTNTFPSWKLAHPYRYICHNGEINTLRGNMNWMYARQSVLASPLFGDDMKKLLPIITAGGSDSAMLDNAVELLTLSGRSLPHVMSMLIPEAWDHDATMPEDIKAFYEYHASLMEPWDGPAAVAFTDGRVIGAKLDRNGLRPGRFLVTTDGLVVLASEAGVLSDQARGSADEGQARARPHFPGGYRAEAADHGRGSQKATGGAAALRAVAQGKPDHARSSAEPDARSADQSRNDPDAAARVRLHRRRLENDSVALRARRRGAGRLDGNRHAAGLSCPTSRKCCSVISSRRSRRSPIRRSIRFAKAW